MKKTPAKKTAKKRQLKKYSKPGEGAMVKPKQVKKNPGRAGRKTVVLPVEHAETWGFLQATHEDIATMCKVSRERVNREFNAESETEFVTLYKRGKAKSRMGLRKAMINKAMQMDQPSISIFTAKNLLNWTDKTEMQSDSEIIIRNELGPKPRFAMDLTDDPEAKN